MDLGKGHEAIFATRIKEADEFYSALRPSVSTEEEAAIMRQAFASMIWSQQFYHFDVKRWLDGDPAQPLRPPPDGAAATSNGNLWTAATSS